MASEAPSRPPGYIRRAGAGRDLSPFPLDLLVVGHTNLDILLTLPHLPAPDTTVPVLHRGMRLGGTAANIARWARHLGVRSALASFVGPDFPARYRQLLRQEGVDLTAFRTRAKGLTPTCWILEDGHGGQATVIDQGAMASLGPREPPPGAVRRSAWVHLTTGDPGYQLSVAREARARGRPVAFDPAQEVRYRWRAADLQRMLPLTEILFGNEGELERLCEIGGFGAVADLVGTVPLVVMTRGPRGVSAFSRTGRLDLPALPVRSLGHVTGAGDAFRGGFYAGWFRGWPLRTCLKGGLAAAAATLRAGRDRGEPLPGLPSRGNPFGDDPKTGSGRSLPQER